MKNERNCVRRLIGSCLLGTAILTAPALAALAPAASPAPSPSPAPAATSCFTVPPGSKLDPIVIDANTGEVISGSLFRERGGTATVVLTRKNPFKYKYAYAVDVQTVDESASITGLLGLISPLGAVAGLWGKDEADAVTKSFATPAPPRPDSTTTPCGGPELILLQNLADEVKRAGAKAIELQNAGAAMKPSFDEAQTAYNNFQPNLQAESIACTVKTVDNARTTAVTLRKFSDGGLSDKIAKFVVEIESIHAIIEHVRPTQDTCRDIRAGLLETTAGLKQRATSLTALGKQLSEGQKAFETMAKVIDEALASDPFYETHYVEGRRAPSKAKVSVTRTLRTKTDDQSTKTVVIEFGRPVFALTIGGGVSSIAEQEFGRESSLVPDGAGGEVLGERFALTKDTDPTFLGAVLLHANLWNWCSKRDVTGALSFGVSIGDNDAASTFGYLFGVSAGMLDRRFYITAAYHLRDVKSLGGGFSPGDVVPADFEGTPLRNHGEEGLMVVFSYRVK